MVTLVRHPYGVDKITETHKVYTYKDTVACIKYKFDESENVFETLSVASSCKIVKFCVLSL